MLISVSVAYASDDKNEDENRQSLIKTYIPNSDQDVNKYLNQNLNEEEENSNNSIKKQGSLKEDIDLNEQLIDAKLQDAISKLSAIKLQGLDKDCDEDLLSSLKQLGSGTVNEAITNLRELKLGLIEEKNIDLASLIQQIIDGLEENNEDKQPNLNHSIIQPSNNSN